MLLNAKGKPFTWSFSALNDFATCPRQYAAKRFYCTVVDDTNEANIWGDRAHKALESRLKTSLPLAPEFAEYERYCAAIDRAPGLLKTELQIAFDKDLKPVSWFSPQAWGRGILDVLLVNGDTAWIWDWKTGKVKENLPQLQLFAAITSILHPEVVKFITRFVWLKHHKVTGEDIMAHQLPFIWDKTFEDIRLVEQAWQYENFPCSPSGLCRGWCPVRECPHWKAKS